jgi:hypothetical protein
MKDSGKSAESQSSFPSTELTDRLLQRVARPVGVIDTRPAEQIHTRTAAWVADKLDLLERYATRYGIVEAVPQVTPTTILRSGSAWPVEGAGHVPSADLPSRLAPETWAAPAAGRISLPERDELRPEERGPDSGTFTVRRAQGSVSTGASPMPQVSKEIPGQAGASPLNLHLRRNRADATPSRAEGVAGQLSTPFDASSREEKGAAQDTRRIKPDGRSAGPEPVSPGAGRAPLPLIKEQKPPATPPVLQRKQAEAPNRTRAHLTEIVRASTGDDVTAHPGTPRATEGFGTASTTKPPLVIRETYPARTAAQSASLIFRKTDGSPATGSEGAQARSLFAGSARTQVPPVLRETTNTLSTGSNELSVIGGPAAPSGSGIDIAEVAEQVSRIISRQLAVDRERRGRVR